jgi:uncharacterized protein YndB with AHSA1/START domain
MTSTVLRHDTIRLERVYPHPPSALFRAYADIERRIAWSAPSADEEVVFDAHDFQVGGIDRFRCGRKGQLDFSGTTRYEQIVADELIVYTERLSGADGALEAVSLVTWQIEAVDGGTRLTLVDQVTSVAGDGPIEGSRHGHTAVLGQLGSFLDGSLG